MSTPADFWTYAKSIDGSADETVQRASISRAYYAAFHACDAWHQALPVPGSNAGPKGGRHQELLNRLRNPDAMIDPAKRSTSKSLSYMLQELKGHRVTADYELTQPIASPVDVCKKAKLILDKAV